MKLIDVCASSLLSLSLLGMPLAGGSAVKASAATQPSQLTDGSTKSPSGSPVAKHDTHSIQPAISRIISVSEGGDLQAALDEAAGGDVILLEAGATFAGNFVLPNRPNSDWITIRSSAEDAALPPFDVRISPSAFEFLPKIVSLTSAPAIRTEARAHHYRLVGLEVTIAPEVRLNHGIVTLGDGNEADAALLPHDLVIDRCYIHGHATADVSRGIALNSASTEIINSRVSEIHGLGFDTQAIAGWNGPGPFKIINNYLEASGENVLFGGADPKIPELVPSDIQFSRNHCSKPLSWKEGILAKPSDVTAAGAATPGSLMAGASYYYRISARGRAGFSTVATSRASDEIAVTLAQTQSSAHITWNAVDHASEYRVYRTRDEPGSASRSWVFHVTTSVSLNDVGDSADPPGSAPPEFGTCWSVKNLFELKNARRVEIDGNVFENNWVDAQSGFAILLTVRNQDGGATWSVVEDVVFKNNIVRHCAAGINLLGRDDLHPSEQVKRVVISGNLFDDVGGSQWGNNGRFLQITETVDVKVDHNTIFQTGNIITAYGTPNEGFKFTNNIAPHNEFGIIGDGSSTGSLSIDQYFPSRVLKKNVIIAGPGSRYPQKNSFPASLVDVGFVDEANGNYRLADTSPYKKAGTKNRDIGADFGVLEETARRALEGLP